MLKTMLPPPPIYTVLLLLLPAVICAQNCMQQETPPNLAEISPQLYRGQQEFTVNMLQVIQKTTPNENIFFSPYSTYHTMLLAYFGANGATEQELRQALHLDWADSKADVRSGYRREKLSRVARAKQMPLEFSSADRIYFDERTHVSSCLQTLLYDELKPLNFRNAERSRLEINSWISNVTHKEIPEMLAPGDVDPSTNLVLANAAYFKGQWLSKFDPSDTKLEPFYTSPSEASLVQMMHKKGNYLLTADERIGAHVLQLPYLTSHDEGSESSIVMVIVLPSSFKDALETVLSKLTPDSLKYALAEGMPREIEISLPTFEFTQRLELVPILRQLGINSIFDHGANFTDFFVDENISFGDAKHVAKIKVDEEGSTASAATVLVSFRSARPIEPTKFICDHPFLFLIYDKKSKAILFTGIYRDPKTK